MKKWETPAINELGLEKTETDHGNYKCGGCGYVLPGSELESVNYDKVCPNPSCDANYWMPTQDVPTLAPTPTES